MLPANLAKPPNPPPPVVPPAPPTSNAALNKDNLKVFTRRWYNFFILKTFKSEGEWVLPPKPPHDAMPEPGDELPDPDAVQDPEFVLVDNAADDVHRFPASCASARREFEFEFWTNKPGGKHRSWPVYVARIKTEGGSSREMYADWLMKFKREFIYAQDALEQQKQQEPEEGFELLKDIDHVDIRGGECRPGQYVLQCDPEQNYKCKFLWWKELGEAELPDYASGICFFLSYVRITRGTKIWDNNCTECWGVCHLLWGGGVGCRADRDGEKI